MPDLRFLHIKNEHHSSLYFIRAICIFQHLGYKSAVPSVAGAYSCRVDTDDAGAGKWGSSLVGVNNE